MLFKSWKYFYKDNTNSLKYKIAKFSYLVNEESNYPLFVFKIIYVIQIIQKLNFVWFKNYEYLNIKNVFFSYIREILTYFLIDKYLSYKQIYLNISFSLFFIILNFFIFILIFILFYKKNPYLYKKIIKILAFYGYILYPILNLYSYNVLISNIYCIKRYYDDTNFCYQSYGIILLIFSILSLIFQLIFFFLVLFFYNDITPFNKNKTSNIDFKYNFLKNVEFLLLVLYLFFDNSQSFSNQFLIILLGTELIIFILKYFLYQTFNFWYNSFTIFFDGALIFILIFLNITLFFGTEKNSLLIGFYYSIILSIFLGFILQNLNFYIFKRKFVNIIKKNNMSKSDFNSYIFKLLIIFENRSNKFFKDLLISSLKIHFDKCDLNCYAYKIFMTKETNTFEYENKFNYYFFLEHVILDGIQKYGNNFYLNYILSNIYIYKTNKLYISIYKINQIKKLKINFLDEIFLLKFEIYLKITKNKLDKKEKNRNFANIYKIIEYENLFERFKLMIYESINNLLIFWRELLEPKPKFNILIKFGNLIYKQNLNIYEVGYKLILINENKKIINILINYFKILSGIKYFEINYIRNFKQIAKNKIKFINELMNNNIISSLIISGNYNNLGEIIFVSNQIENIIGFKIKDLNGNSLNNIIPSFYSNQHNHDINNYFESNCNTSFHKKSFNFLKNKNGYLVPVKILVKIHFNLKFGIKIVSLIQKVEKFNTFFIFNKDNFKILGVSKLFIKKYNFPNNLENSNFLKLNDITLDLFSHNLSSHLNEYITKNSFKLTLNLKFLNQNIIENNNNEDLNNSRLIYESERKINTDIETYGRLENLDIPNLNIFCYFFNENESLYNSNKFILNNNYFETKLEESNKAKVSKIKTLKNSDFDDLKENEDNFNFNYKEYVNNHSLKHIPKHLKYFISLFFFSIILIIVICFIKLYFNIYLNNIYTEFNSIIDISKKRSTSFMRIYYYSKIKYLKLSNNNDNIYDRVLPTKSSIDNEIIFLQSTQTKFFEINIKIDNLTKKNTNNILLDIRLFLFNGEITIQKQTLNESIISLLTEINQITTLKLSNFQSKYDAFFFIFENTFDKIFKENNERFKYFENYYNKEIDNTVLLIQIFIGLISFFLFINVIFIVLIYYQIIKLRKKLILYFFKIEDYLIEKIIKNIENFYIRYLRKYMIFLMEFDKSNDIENDLKIEEDNEENNKKHRLNKKFNKTNIINYDDENIKKYFKNDKNQKYKLINKQDYIKFKFDKKIIIKWISNIIKTFIILILILLILIPLKFYTFNYKNYKINKIILYDNIINNLYLNNLVIEKKSNNNQINKSKEDQFDNLFASEVKLINELQQIFNNKNLYFFDDYFKNFEIIFYKNLCLFNSKNINCTNNKYKFFLFKGLIIIINNNINNFISNFDNNIKFGNYITSENFQNIYYFNNLNRNLILDLITILDNNQNNFLYYLFIVYFIYLVIIILMLIYILIIYSIYDIKKFKNDLWITKNLISLIPINIIQENKDLKMYFKNERKNY